MHPILEKQERLYCEATELLNLYIYPILNNYGKVLEGGSYVYRLLNQPDIDLDVVNPELTKGMYADLCSELIAIDMVSTFRTCDRVNYPNKHSGDRPTGYWISPEVNYKDNVWNFDIWFQIPEWNSGNTSSYEQKLSGISEEKRIAILCLKEELSREGIYGVGKEFVSVDIYEGVLNKGVTTVSELRANK